MGSRKLEIIIAEELGYKKYLHDHNYNDWLYHVPQCSTDGNDMIWLIKEMRKRRWKLTKVKYVNPNTVIVEYTYSVVEGLPRAIMWLKLNL